MSWGTSRRRAGSEELPRSLIQLGPIVVLFLIHAWLFRRFFIDDSFIVFRFVKQWVSGNGLVFNVGERVEGYSSFLWIVTLAPFEWLGVDLVSASKVLGVVLAIAILVVTYRANPHSQWAFVAPLFLACSAPFAVWAMGGLETLLFAFLTTASACCFIREEEHGYGWLSGALFGLLVMTRPEGVLLVAVAIAFRVEELWSDRMGPEKRDLQRLGALLAIAVPFHLWRYAYYGDLVPNPVRAKAMGLHLRALLEGGHYVYLCVRAGGGFFLLAIAAVLAWTSPRRLIVGYFSATIAAYLLAILLGGGDWMPEQRLLVHVLPLVYLVVHEGIIQVPRLWPRWRTGVLVAWFVFGQAAYLSASALHTRIVDRRGGDPLDPGKEPVIAYLLDTAEPMDTVAAVVPGAIAYLLPVTTRVVDMVGLTDRHIAGVEPQFPSGLSGRGDAFGKWDVDYVLRQEPRFVQVVLEPGSSDGRERTNFTGTTLLINDPRFVERFEPVRAAGITGLFVRKVAE